MVNEIKFDAKKNFHNKKLTHFYLNFIKNNQKQIETQKYIVLGFIDLLFTFFFMFCKITFLTFSLQ